MPDDKTEIDEYQKEQKEFDESVEEIFAEDAKTDDEILKAKEDEDAKKKAEADAASGDATKDQSKTSTDDLTKQATQGDDMFSSGQPATKKDGETTVATKKPEDVPTETELVAKVASLEDELQKETQKTSSWNGRITAANEKVKLLEAEIVELKATNKVKDPKVEAQKESDNEVLEKFRKDFPELGDVVDVLQRRVDAATGRQKPAEKKADPGTAKSPDVPPEVNPDTGKTEHMDTITKAHGDLDEMVNSGVLKTWINKQKPFIQSHLETIYLKGNSQQVIEMISQFKESTGWKSQLSTEDTTKQDKLKSMLEVNSETVTPTGKTVDKDDFDAAAKEAGL